VKQRIASSRLSAIFLFTTLLIPGAFAQHIIGHVSVGSEPKGVAANPVTGDIYVANVLSGNISVLLKNSVVATIPVNTLPGVVALNSKTNRVYAAGCNFQTGAGSLVDVIDGATNKVIASIPLNHSCSIGTQGIAVNSRTNRVYVSDYDDSQEIVIDGATNKIVTRIDLAGHLPLGVAINPANNQVWVALDGPAGNVDVIDGGSNTVLETITVASVFVDDVAINPATQRAYISSPSSPSSVYVFDASNLQPITSIPFGQFETSLTVDPLTNLIFVADGNLNEVGVIDGNTNSLIATVALNGTFPNGIAANPATKIVYVTELDSAQVELLTEK
jgi:DNA-binding beta-propeller fold protein YncE